MILVPELSILFVKVHEYSGRSNTPFVFFLHAYGHLETELVKELWELVMPNCDWFILNWSQ